MPNDKRPQRRAANWPFRSKASSSPRPPVLVALILLSGWMAVAPAQEPEKSMPSVTSPPVVPLPGPGRLIVSCDPGGCWDEFGVRYDRADPGVFVRVDGKSCLMSKGRMHCE